LLRSAKSVKKTTNFGSCRDINGRRLRDVDNEKRMAEWRARQEQAKADIKERKDAKKIKRKEASKPTEDVLFNNLRKDAESVNAVEKGLAARKKQLEEKKRKRDEPKTKFIEYDDSDTESSDDDKKHKKKKQRTEEKLQQTTTTTTTTTITITATIDDKSSSTPSTPEEVNDKQQKKEENTESTEPLAEGGMKRTCVPEPIDLMCYSSAVELEVLGLIALKSELMRLGLKIGGNLKQRAERLWSTKGLTPDLYDPAIKAVAMNNTNKRRKK